MAIYSTTIARSHLQTTNNKVIKSPALQSLGTTPPAILGQIKDIVDTLPKFATIATQQTLTINSIPLDQFPTTKNYFGTYSPIMTENHYAAYKLYKSSQTGDSFPFPYLKFISESGPTTATHSPSEAELANGHGPDRDFDCPTCVFQLFDPMEQQSFPTQFQDPLSVIHLPCGHAFHTGCLEDQITAQVPSLNCALCAAPILPLLAGPQKGDGVLTITYQQPTPAPPAPDTTAIANPDTVDANQTAAATTTTTEPESTTTAPLSAPVTIENIVVEIEWKPSISPPESPFTTPVTAPPSGVAGPNGQKWSYSLQPNNFSCGVIIPLIVKAFLTRHITPITYKSKEDLGKLATEGDCGVFIIGQEDEKDLVKSLLISPAVKMYAEDFGL